MQIGLKLPSSGPMATPAFLAELAQMGDRLGFSSLQVSDHVVIPAQIHSAYPYNATHTMAARPDTTYYEPIGLLGFLAGCTERIRLGTSVLVLPYRHPVLAAKQLASIDSLSGGRLFLGVGVGWMQEEFEILGAPPYAERGAISDEYIQVFRTLWRDERPQFEGRYSHFPPLGALPRPAQAGGIPILVGGNTRAAIRRAVQLGDGWQPLNLAPDALVDGLQYLRKLAATAKRDLNQFQTSLGLGLRMSSSPLEPREGEGSWTTLTGSARDIMGHLRTYRDLGVTEIAFSFRTCTTEDEVRETMELCGRDLVRAFSEA